LRYSYAAYATAPAPTAASTSGCSGLAFLAGDGELELLAVVEAAFTLAVEALLGAAADFLAALLVVVPVVKALTVNGWWMTLAPPAVGVVVQYQVPFASAQLCPSSAVA